MGVYIWICVLDYLNKTQDSRSFGAKPPCQDFLQYDFPKIGPFGIFPKIHPFWLRHPSLMFINSLGAFWFCDFHVLLMCIHRGSYLINQSINVENVGHFFSLDFKTCLCCTFAQSGKNAEMQKCTRQLKNFQLAWQSCHCHWLVLWRVQKRRNFDVCLLWILITIFSMWKSNHYFF